MTSRFINGQTIDETDYIQASTGSSDAGKAVVTKDADGRIDLSFGLNGGTGADGALTITSGTTNIDCGGALYVEKNYTNVSITGTGKLTFSNPHAFGTKIKIRSQQGFTLTSSASPNIDASEMGGEGGGSQGGSNFMARSDPGKGYNNTGAQPVMGYNAGNIAGQNGNNISDVSQNFYHALTATSATSMSIRAGQHPPISQDADIFPGGGGSGGCASSAFGTHSAGSRGGGALDLETSGTWNFTGTIWAKAGTSSAADARGGYGAGGTVRALVGSITANTGTISVTSSGNAGQSLVAVNITKF